MYQFMKSSVAAKALRIAALSLAMTFIAGPMEAWANGNIFYNFSFIGNNGNVLGQFEVQPGAGAGSFPDLVVGVTGTVSGFGSGNGSITGLLEPYAYFANTNYFSPNSPYVDGQSIFPPGGVGFTTGEDFVIKYNSLNWSVVPAEAGISAGTLDVSLSQ